MKKINNILKRTWEKYGIKCYVFYKGPGLVTKLLPEKNNIKSKRLEVGLKNITEHKFLFCADSELIEILKPGAEVIVSDKKFDVVTTQTIEYKGGPCYISAICREVGCL